MHSEQINEIAQALAKAQGQMRAATKDAVNPHLRNNYATLSSIIESARGPLSTNGLAFSQILSQGSSGLVLETILMHSSGQWLQSEMLVDATAANKGVNQAQALGSALTYYKRYALAALLGISVAEEDDDGNAAAPARQQRKTEEERPRPEQRPVQEVPKTNGGHKGGKVASDPSTRFWATAKEMELSIPKAQAILKEAGNDFTVALDRLTGTAQEPAPVEQFATDETGY